MSTFDSSDYDGETELEENEEKEARYRHSWLCSRNSASQYRDRTKMARDGSGYNINILAFGRITCNKRMLREKNRRWFYKKGFGRKGQTVLVAGYGEESSGTTQERA